MQEFPDFLRVEEVGKILDISRAKAYSLAKQKKIPTFWVGRSVRIPKKEFLEWIKNNTEIEQENAMIK
ncbi:helix-turn-helix domain-containing protein [candidate division NPL-UPA2 bacterium]|nr:helix-turn-helix domain-containing protein [candidate division NPL-UPA2 bacterium]